jgi:exopolysaccharide biosynthesis polyprenyl glycosylphosphotransferase
MRRSGYFLSPALIIGANDEGKMLSEQLRQWKSSGFHVVGFVDKKLHVGDQVTKDLRVLGKMEELDQVIEKYNISEIILASSAVSSRDKMIEIFKKFAFSDQVNVRFSSGLYEIITTGLEVNKFAYVPLMGVSPVRLSGIEQALKLILDYLIASIAIVVLSPILVVAAIAIKLDSPGPILHRRRIIGLNGKEFDAFKFRSMRTDGEKILAEYPELQKELEENHKLKHDPRITRIGRFVRRTSIDELPQFFNVLRGEMSVVGPRMITPDEIAKYDQWDVNLLTVKPGITGLWQISGRSDVTYEERVRLDMYYIRNWNIWLDTQIIIQTIPAVIKGKGAY